MLPPSTGPGLRWLIAAGLTVLTIIAIVLAVAPAAH